MANQSNPPRINALSDISSAYDAILCDVWGVLHNGVQAFPTAHQSLSQYRQSRSGAVVLVTNAPRPNPPIALQLDDLGVARSAYDQIVTSGDVTIDAILRTQGDKAYHLGPERDRNIFDDLPISLVEADAADFIVCTGLFDDITETPDDYRAEFERLVPKGLPMICANPDLVVHRGGQEVYCAGALAQLYEELGGFVEINGKPHAPIYRAALERLKTVTPAPIEPSRILAIGDAFRTDVKGAVDAGFDCLLITSGIHKNLFGPADQPEPTRVHEELAAAGLGAVAFMPTLA